MGKSVTDILDDVKNLPIPTVVKRFLVSLPIGVSGFALSEGIDTTVQAFWIGPLDKLGEVTKELTGASFGSLAEILNAGADASIGSLSEFGIAGWLVAIVLVVISLEVLSRLLDRFNIDTLSGIDIPIIGRFLGATDEE
ncbi:hypothetical protein G3I44_04130 [Halogeometricum borinquense]|uniref:Uncharacterized protein n=1 Tax=Halogeometricum borinquense TaxID=60847 RepID=A0A6C0UH03_9EURY|nr:hypothetical protein [Halogeometricum borinquense]QIB73541.1 hypothetical protein G3I44_04130 [Halogeometricum borinquense]